MYARFLIAKLSCCHLDRNDRRVRLHISMSFLCVTLGRSKDPDGLSFVILAQKKFGQMLAKIAQKTKIGEIDRLYKVHFVVFTLSGGRYDRTLHFYQVFLNLHQMEFN